MQTFHSPTDPCKQALNLQAFYYFSVETEFPERAADTGFYTQVCQTVVAQLLGGSSA